MVASYQSVFRLYSPKPEIITFAGLFALGPRVSFSVATLVEPSTTLSATSEFA